jgi:hypothetical protein
MMEVGNAISLRDEEWSSINGNTFSYVKSPQTGEPRDNALVVNASSGVPESTHLVFSGNYFERCGGVSIVALKGHGFCSITGNAFGRLGFGAKGTIHIEGGSGNILSANNFHNVGSGANRPSIEVTGGDGLIVSSNAFSIPQDTQIKLASVSGVLVEGNQFLGDTGGAPHLTLTDVTGGSVTGNRFTCLTSHAIGLSAGSATTVFICANTLNPALNCSGTLLPTNTGNYQVLDCDTVPGGNPKF